MTRSWRALAALLLAVTPVAAQIRVVPTVPLAPVAVAPISVAPLSAAPLALSASAAPALLASPAAALPVSALAAPIAAPAAVTPAAAAAPALASPSFAAAADVFKPRGGTPSAEEPTGVSFNRKLFDGAGELKTRSGSVFSPARVDIPGAKGFAFVRIKAAPAAAVKPVPNTQGLSGSALLKRVSQIAAMGQTTHEYREASHYLFGTADNHALNGIHGVADAYSGVFVPGTSADGHDYHESGDPSHDGWERGQVMNVEHVFPQSLFSQHIPMRSDLHHLMATLEHPNGMRGNLPFGVVTGPADYHNAAGAKRGGNHFEPPDFTKGRVARAMLYFHARYKDQAFFASPAAIAFWDGQIETLLDWNRRFPPTVEERTRNDQVQAFQGNRNPYVDDPGMADRIGADALRLGAPPARRVQTIVQVEQSPRRRSDKPRKGKKRSTFKRAFSPRGRRR